MTPNDILPYPEISVLLSNHLIQRLIQIIQLIQRFTSAQYLETLEHSIYIGARHHFSSLRLREYLKKYKRF